MDKLDFIAGNNKNVLDKLRDLGCDLSTLLIVAEDVFRICDELGLTARDSADLVCRLKTLYDFKKFGTAEPRLEVYENKSTGATKLAVRNCWSGNTVLFIGSSENGFVCEACGHRLPRGQIKDHILTAHREA